MKIDEKVAVTADNLMEEGVGDTRGRAAVFAARKVTVQVPTVRQVAAGATETIEINNRNANDSAVHFYRFELVHQTPHHLDAIQFIAMYRGGQAYPGSRIFPVCNEHRHRGVDAGK